MIAPPEHAAGIIGAPDSAELLAQRLTRAAAGSARAAQTVPTRPPDWQGAAAAAYTHAAASSVSRATRAADVLSAAALVLTLYAAELRAALAIARQAEQLLDDAATASSAWAASAPAPTGPGPGETLRSSGLRMRSSARQAAADAANEAARRLGPLSADLGDLPRASPERRFVAGLAEEAVALVDVVRHLGPLAVTDPVGALRYGVDYASSLRDGVQHPVEFGKAAIDWDIWSHDRARAAGHLVPGVVLAALTGAASRLTQLPAHLADVPPSLRTVPHRLEEINGAPGGPHFDNCPSCAIAVDQTLAGAPASAIPNRPLVLRDLASLYDGMFVMADRDWIVSQLSAAPSGARGIVFGMRTDGRPGHVFNAVQEAGRVYFIDGQTGASGVFQDSFTQVFFLRTDHRTVTGAIDKEPR